jgi:hypothetical protein
MKTVARSNWLIGFFVSVPLFCMALPVAAQDARLKLADLEKLSAKAVEVNSVTLDGDMLQLAAKFLDMDKDDPESEQVKSLIKNLKGIYVKNFEFDQPNQYSASDVEEIRSQLAAPGWNKIVESRDKRANENNEIYVMKDSHNNVAGIAILVAEPKELTVVNIVGPLDLDKLSALGGKFGIPGDKEKEQPKKKTAPEASHDKS